MSVKFTPLQLPARRLTDADYQYITEIWETFGKHYEHELHILHTLFLHVLCHPQHPLVDVVGEFSLHRQGYDNVGGDAKTFRREVLLVEA